MSSPILDKVQAVHGALQHLRASLENNDLDALPQALMQAQSAVDGLNAYPGSVDQLRVDIDQMPQAEQQHVRQNDV